MTQLPVFVLAFALGAFAALSALVVTLKRGGAPGRGTYAWFSLFMLLLATSCVIVLGGSYDSEDVTMPCVCVLTMAGAAALSLLRERRNELASSPMHMPSHAPKAEGGLRGRLRAALSSDVGRMTLRNLVSILVAGCFALYALEEPWQHALPNIKAKALFFELAFIWLLMLAGYFLFQRRIVGAAVAHGAVVLAGVAQLLVVTQRGGVIMPGDVFALGTAAAVTSGLQLLVGPDLFCGLTAGTLGFLVLALDPLWGGRTRRDEPTSESQDSAQPREAQLARKVSGVALNLALCAASCLAFGRVAVASHAYLQSEGVNLWLPAMFYQQYGSVPTFAMAALELDIKAPAGYDAQTTRRAEGDLARQAESLLDDDAHRAAAAQFEAMRPTVIGVMNETFADLSTYPEVLEAGYAGPGFALSIHDAVRRGVAYTSVLGGGTCNSEFEFLTGVSMACVGPGKYPYNMCDFSHIPSLARQFADLGYVTTAMHPSLSSNWSRSRVYKQMGFDRFLSIDDFAGAPLFHSCVTDRATYDKILELLEADQSPQFIFDVTMQNHMGYDLGNIPEDRLTNVTLPWFGEDQNRQLNEYLSCVQASDDDLRYFVERLRELDRPVVLVFFGDHQPIISPWIVEACHSEESEAAKTRMSFQTPYLIWANYELDGCAQEGERHDLSLNYLASVMGERMGLPLTDTQKATLMLMDDLPAVTLNGYLDTEGRWVNSTDGSGEPTGAYKLLRDIGYRDLASRA
ncbi:LTA synthase family protein [Olsenella massiliensis]|uniref:LTA synthase family protein n=1 Tax=Olsenella massiliensis TaxID=1622075 RepID=UPI00071D0794|nr:alkaline phosphatase family protein [Olsenella massiliensis]